MLPTNRLAFSALATMRSRVYWLRRAMSPSPWMTQMRRDGAAGADKAEPALRRTTRSTAYKGPADTFKVMPSHVMQCSTPSLYCFP